MPIGYGVELGPVSLPVYRIILAIGLVRVFVRRETVVGGINVIDKLVIAWAVWMVFAGFFHEWRPGSGPLYASGFVFNAGLVYFLIRIWCNDVESLSSVIRFVGWLLVPVALAMIAEHLVEKNYFGALLGGVPEGVYVRDGQIRAQGPFAHPILAGVVGAVNVPLMLGIWRRYRISATVGLAASVSMVVASTSSAPMMSMIFGVAGVIMWRHRPWVPVIRWGVLALYICAELLMSRPAYYLISKIDLTGSSTGWHRSRLIEMAIAHFPRWWAFGTDYTGDWMAQTVDVEGRSADITNYYIWIGTIGGFLAMVLVIAMLWRAFVWVGKSVAAAPPAIHEYRFLIWCLGASLFAHAATGLSVSYTDQSMMFFWLNIGAISSLFSAVNALSSDRIGASKSGLLRPQWPVPRSIREPGGRRIKRRAKPGN